MPTRRRTVAWIGTGAVSVLAGCTSSGTDADENGTGADDGGTDGSENGPEAEATDYGVDVESILDAVDFESDDWEERDRDVATNEGSRELERHDRTERLVVRVDGYDDADAVAGRIEDEYESLSSVEPDAETILHEYRPAGSNDDAEYDRDDIGDEAVLLEHRFSGEGPPGVAEVLFRVDNVLVSIAHGHVDYVVLPVAKTYALDLHDQWPA